MRRVNTAAAVGVMSYSPPCPTDTRGSPHMSAVKSEKLLVPMVFETPPQVPFPLMEPSPRQEDAHFRPVRYSSYVPQRAAGSAQACPDALPTCTRFDEDLPLTGETFDPVADVLVRHRLVLTLGLEPGTIVEAVRGRGGLNDGIWSIRARGGNSFIMKLVRRPEEASNFRRLRSEHPDIAHDGSLAFPTNIMRLLNPSGQRVYDLIVMRTARGQSIGDFIAEKHYSGRGHEIPKALELVGACVATFHRSYGGKQHGDLQSSNVFIDEASGHVTLIDVGGMGLYGAEDNQHFTHSLNLLLNAYSAQLEAACRHSFDRGYRSAQCGGTARHPGATLTPPTAIPARFEKHLAVPMRRSFPVLVPVH